MTTVKRTDSIVWVMLSMALVLTAAGCGSGEHDHDHGEEAAAAEQGRTLPIPGSAGDELPEGHPPVGTGGDIIPPPPGSGSGSAGLAWQTPDGWVEEPPSSQMRKAQYRVPGSAGDGQCVVFYFGPGQGGEPMANAARWAGQFAQPGGGDPIAAMKTREETIGGRSVLHVETTGTYQNPMASDPPLENAMLLAAIVQGPDANWFFKLTGPVDTVEAQRDAFGGLIASITSGS